MAIVRIPYTPRYPEIHDVLDRTRFVVLVAHRRFGKTVLAVNHLIRLALTCRRQAGSFAYVAPFRNQAKSVAWAYCKRFTARVPGRTVREGELSITFANGASVRLFGADNADALRGLYFDAVVMDEVAQMARDVWGEIVRPALADRNGSALFIGTPKGENLFHELYVQAQADRTGQWRALTYRVGDTAALSGEEVARLRAEMGEQAFAQEFLCDFAAECRDQLIPLQVAQDAVGRQIGQNGQAAPSDAAMPLLLGVDVARFGNDRTVLFARQGQTALPPVVLRGADNVAVAGRIISWYQEHMRGQQGAFAGHDGYAGYAGHAGRPTAIFVDAGQGQGVIDMLRQTLPCVHEVPFGGRALNAARFADRRSEMWALMGQWLRHGGILPRVEGLVGELAAPRYSFDDRGRLLLEKKDAMHKRLGRSPDMADALALTFAMPVLPPELNLRQPYADQNHGAQYDEHFGENRYDFAA